MNPAKHYEQFFASINTERTFKGEQVDVRRMPSYYAHRKVAEILEQRHHFLSHEKERKLGPLV
jgi:hypothetical protein